MIRLFRKRDCAIDGHRFDPRYDEQPNEPKLSRVRGCSPEEFRELIIRRVYVRDVCRHCGATLERQP